MLKIQSPKPRQDKTAFFFFSRNKQFGKINCSPTLASNSCKVDSTTAGVVTNRTKINSNVLISTALTHQLSLSTERCSQIMSPANGACDTFQWSEKILRDTDDSGLPCLIVLKSFRHLQDREKWKKEGMSFQRNCGTASVGCIEG